MLVETEYMAIGRRDSTEMYLFIKVKTREFNKMKQFEYIG